MLDSLKANWKQLLVFALSVAVAAGLHFGKLSVDQAIGLGGVAAAFGLHLPAFVYKVPTKLPPTLPLMLAAWTVVGAVVACFAVARTQYGLQLDSCIDKAATRTQADACMAAVRLSWDEAGASPALVISTDAGGR